MRGARKVAVIGAGNVGATCAFILAQMNIGEIVMLDIYEGFAKGKALDMSQGGQILNYDGKISGTKARSVQCCHPVYCPQASLWEATEAPRWTPQPRG